MSQNVRIELNSSGIRELLRSDEVQDAVYEIANGRAQALGSGYAADRKLMPTRAISSVYTETRAAYQDNLENNTLLRAIS